ncbi:uncharacterized protein LOC122523191 [Polistes fuscatus]|uniref:uncharacterized protein LOC122523191 n=1 Tax=Polistes fuscatus TaxID=30207 RepID=UPI001CA8D4EE|nr:uncharacterized protein LOC122523191 [Polistes fuscatus]
MNESVIIMGVAAVMSAVFFGLLAYNLRTIMTDTDLSNLSMLRDRSSLEEDFRDILGFLPLVEIEMTINNYVQYDEQLNETVNFINDQRRFIFSELQSIPQVCHFINMLKENGLDVDYWSESIERIWKSMPSFVVSDECIVSGGLTGMISRILKIIPRNELHILLQQKLRYSQSFRKLINYLRSRSFNDLCTAMEENAGLQRHYYWAKESGLEIVFAIEFIRNLYFYLTEELG